jgi:Na+-driven multidrug efflux pump
MRNEAVIAQLTRGSIAKTVFTLTIPMIFSTMGMVVFNLVDTFFVIRRDLRFPWPFPWALASCSQR